MPWKRAKALPPPDNELFETCFRIQREACEAAGRHIPLIVENVRGAQKWVGRARWSFGSYYLWGDVPALMPITLRAAKGKPFGMKRWTNPAEGRKQQGSGAAWWDKALDERRKEATAMMREGIKHNGDWFRDPACPTRQGGQTGRKYDVPSCDGIKRPGIELGEVGFNVANAREFAHMVEGVKIERSADDKRQHIGTSRKFASAMIAKIPLPLSRHIGAVFRPMPMMEAAE
jgi:hypothetical protein